MSCPIFSYYGLGHLSNYAQPFPCHYRIKKFGCRPIDITCRGNPSRSTLRAVVASRSTLCEALFELSRADTAPIRGAKAGLPLRNVRMTLRSNGYHWAVCWGDLNPLPRTATSMVFAFQTGGAVKVDSGNGIIMNTLSVMK